MNILLFHKFIIAAGMLAVGLFVNPELARTQTTQEEPKEAPKHSEKIVRVITVRPNEDGASVVSTQKDGKPWVFTQADAGGQKITVVVERPNSDKTAPGGKIVRRKAIIRTQSLVKTDKNMSEDMKEKMQTLGKELQIQTGDGTKGEMQVQLTGDESAENSSSVQIFRVNGNIDTTVVDDKQMKIMIRKLDGTGDMPIEVKELINKNTNGDMQPVEINGSDIHGMNSSDDAINGKMVELIRSLQTHGGMDSVIDADGNKIKVFVQKIDGAISDDTKDMVKELAVDINISSGNTVIRKYNIILVNDERDTAPDNAANSTDTKNTLDARTMPLDVSNFSAFPNPSNGIIQVAFDAPQGGNVTVKVVDLAGNTVFFDQPKQFTGHYKQQIDLTGKSKGMYILRIEQGGKSLIKKIILE